MLFCATLTTYKMSDYTRVDTRINELSVEIHVEADWPQWWGSLEEET